MHKHKITGIILAGGLSSRMGTDKGFIHYKGHTLIELSLHIVKPYCSEVLISANNKTYSNFELPVIPDEIKGIGPLGGILGCLKKAMFEKTLITACDMPSIESGIVKSLLEASHKADAVYLKLPSGMIQSLPLVLSKNTIQIIESQIQQRQYALHKLIQECIRSELLRSKDIVIEKEIKNINTQKDLYSD